MSAPGPLRRKLQGASALVALIVIGWLSQSYWGPVLSSGYDWAAAQPIFVQVAVGIVLVGACYVLMLAIVALVLIAANSE